LGIEQGKTAHQYEKGIVKRVILYFGVITALLLMGWNCEPTTPGLQKITAQSRPQPIEPKPAETQPKQTEIEANVPPAKHTEPNLPAVSQPAPSKVEGPSPPVVKSIEPNTQTQTKPEPPAQKSAQSNVAEPNNRTESKTANELCNKCTALLSKYVDKDGFVNYRMLLRKKLELLEISDSFKTLSRKDYDSWSRNDKIASWINAYNLELVKIILDNYPIESNRFMRLFWPPNSIRHIKGIWDEHKFIIMDEEFTLRALENRYFVNEFNEPRALLAISYASISAPPLRNEAYCGKDLSAQLDEQVKKFLSRPQNFKINRDSGLVSISSILSPSWQGGKFISKYGTDLKFKSQEPTVRAVLNFLTKYVPQQDVDYLETANFTIEYINYDWTLNDHSGPQGGRVSYKNERAHTNGG
jgi:hypothetical protein